MSKSFFFHTPLLMLFSLLLLFPMLLMGQIDPNHVEVSITPDPVVQEDGSLDTTPQKVSLSIMIDDVSGLKAAIIEKGNTNTRTYEAPISIIYGANVPGVSYENNGKKMTLDLGNSTEDEAAHLMFRVFLDYELSENNPEDTYVYYP